MNEGELNPDFGGGRQNFVVFAEPLGRVKPGKTAFNHTQRFGKTLKGWASLRLIT
jgi:hypothetical protein